MSVDPVASIAEALDNPRPAPQLVQAGDPGPEMEAYERPPFPKGGPVRPLGISSGIDGSQKCYYLNWNGQLVGLEANNRHGKLGLIALYGPASDFLEAQWPQWSEPKYEGRGNARVMVKPSEIVGFDQAEAARAHVEACVAAGIFEPSGRMRGRGAHRLSAGAGMALHCGDKLLVSELTVEGRIKGWRWIDVGLHEGFVYTAAARIPRPWHEPVGLKAAEKALRLLRTWNWKRELLDPRFALGAIGASSIGGWLPWRPNIWITGARGTGKSTLNGKDGAIHQMFGDGVFRTGDTSAAGLRQRMLNGTVPVMIDEAEAEEDNRRVGEVMKLARLASSGDSLTRGGQDHQAHDFTLQSVFWFSSINIPPMQPQDRSRFAILELKPLRKDTAPLVLSKWALPDLGRQLQRRMIDGLARLEETKAKFHLALQQVGHDARACDQFGTLLACADLLLEEWNTEDGLPPDEEVNHWAGLCRPERIAEVSGATSEEAACLQHITTSAVQSRGGDEREAIGTWIGRALAHAAAGIFNRTQEAGDERAGKKLEQLGLKIVNARYRPAQRGADGKVTRAASWGAQSFMAGEPGFLAIAWSHQTLGDLFKGTKWQAGVWRQALGRCGDAIDGVKVKFAHSSLTAVLVPLYHLFPDDEDEPQSERQLPDASRRAALAQWVAEQAGEGAEA